MSEQNTDNNNNQPNILNNPFVQEGVRNVEGIRRRIVRIQWRKRMQTVGIIHIVLALLLLTWSQSSHSGTMLNTETGPDSGEKTKFTPIVTDASYVLQVFMGTALITSLRKQSDATLACFLRIYLVFAYLLMVTFTLVIVISIALINESKITGYERFQTIFGSNINLIYHIISTWILETYLKQHKNHFSTGVRNQQQFS